MRLDVYLVEKQFVATRKKGQQLIKGGAVRIDGAVVQKVSYQICGNPHIELDTSHTYVSRAGEKLACFLSKHGEISLRNRRVLDIGSSTGGFSEVALQVGAQSIVCVDVGRNQLHERLRLNKRVELYEEMDIRHFFPNANISSPHERFSFVICDVSFISLSKILPEIARLCSSEAIVLFKPQFEVGVGVKRNRKGVVVDTRRIRMRLEEFCNECAANGFEVRLCEPSEIKGKEGNEEFFLYLWRCEC